MIKFFEVETKPYGIKEMEEEGFTGKYRDLIGGSNSSYGMKAGEKDGVKISYSDGSSPKLPLVYKW